MAAADAEVDPAVTAVQEESRSASATPPPASQARTPPRRARNSDPDPSSAPAPTPSLADTLAGIAANAGQQPGTADGDYLLSGSAGGDSDLDATAVEEQRKRGKSKTDKRQLEPNADTASETDLPAPKRRKSGGTGKGSGNTRESSGTSARRTSGSRRASQAGGTKARETVVVDSDDSNGSMVRVPKEGSRHLPVTVSQIYMDWNGPVLDDVRRRFQALMFARDGYPLKLQMYHKQLNYKLVLRAAQAVMSAKDYTAFSSQMDRAFQDHNKS